MVNQPGNPDLEKEIGKPVTLLGRMCIFPRIDRALQLSEKKRFVCSQVHHLTATLLTKTPAEILEFSPQLLSLSLQELQSLTGFFANLAHDTIQGTQLRSPEAWAGEFLSEPMTDPVNYFKGASDNAYAMCGKSGQILVYLAAAYAWKLREKDPDFTVPGTLAHSMKTWDQTTQKVWQRNTSRFTAHSYDIEGVNISSELLEADLARAFPHSNHSAD